MKRIKVRCTVIVELDWHDDWVDPFFDIEENSCPGTHSVGLAIDGAIKKGEEESICWACPLQGKNEILEIDGVPVAALREITQA